MAKQCKSCGIDLEGSDALCPNCASSEKTHAQMKHVSAADIAAQSTEPEPAAPVAEASGKKVMVSLNMQDISAGKHVDQVKEKNQETRIMPVANPAPEAKDPLKQNQRPIQSGSDTEEVIPETKDLKTVPGLSVDRAKFDQPAAVPSFGSDEPSGSMPQPKVAPKEAAPEVVPDDDDAEGMMASSESESGEIGHKDDEQVLEPQASKRKYKIKGAKTGQNLAENAVIRGGKTTQLKRPPLRKPGIFAFKNMIIFMLILAAAIYAVQFYLHNFTDPDIDISEMVPSRYNGVVTVNVHQLVHDKETRAYLEEHLSPGGTASKKLELWNSQLDKNGLGLGDITRIYYFFECEKINTEQAKKPDFFCVITSRNPINLNGFMEFLRTQLGAKDSLQQAKVNDRQYYELKWGGQKLEFKLGASNVLLLATDKALLESISNPSRITTASTLYQKTEGLKKEGLVWAAFSDEVDIPNLNNYTLEKGIILIDHKENLTFESNVTFKKANQAETFAKFIKSKYTKDKFDEVGLKQEDIQLDQKGKDLKCQFDIPGKTFGSYIEKYLDAVFKKEEKKKK